MLSNYSIKGSCSFEIILNAAMLDAFPKAWVIFLLHIFKSHIWVTFTHLTRGPGKLFFFFFILLLEHPDYFSLQWLWNRLGGQKACLLICSSLFKFPLFFFFFFCFPLLLLLWPMGVGQNQPFELEILIRSQRDCYSGDCWQRGGS